MFVGNYNNDFFLRFIIEIGEKCGKSMLSCSILSFISLNRCIQLKSTQCRTRDYECETTHTFSIGTRAFNHTKHPSTLKHISSKPITIHLECILESVISAIQTNSLAPPSIHMNRTCSGLKSIDNVNLIGQRYWTKDCIFNLILSRQC